MKLSILRPITSLLSKSEKALQKLTVGSWQHTMLQNNIRALKIALVFMEQKTDQAHSFHTDELQKAFESILSMIDRAKKAQSAFNLGTSHHTLQQNRIIALGVAGKMIQNAKKRQSEN